MGVAQAFADHDAVAIVRLQRKGEYAARRKHARGFTQHRREIAHIDHGIGGKDQVGAGVRLAAQARDHVGDFELGIESGGARLLDHAAATDRCR